MRSIQLLVSVLLTASITAYVTYKKHDQIEEIIDPPRVSIFSNITIGDTCGVQKNFFEVVDLDLGVRVPVRRGKARIKTFEGNQIQLQISSQFKSRYDYWKKTSFTNDEWAQIIKHCQKEKIMS